MKVMESSRNEFYAVSVLAYNLLEAHTDALCHCDVDGDTEIQYMYHDCIFRDDLLILLISSSVVSSDIYRYHFVDVYL